MEITWYGLGMFRITERGYPAVIAEPWEADVPLPKVRADIVTTSYILDDPRTKHWKGLRGSPVTLAAPGEYEIGGLFITGVAAFADRKNGAEQGETVLYALNYGAITVAHLGRLGHVPSQSTVEKLGNVNVLLLPVGLPDALTPAMAAEVVNMIEPNIVIPMEYKVERAPFKVARRPLRPFLKEIGGQDVEPRPSFKFNARDLPEETQIVLLRPQGIG